MTQHEIRTGTMESLTVHHKLKHDRFTGARGGSSVFLDLYCGACRTHIALYQKDGPGHLFRLYRDRIFEPPSLQSVPSDTGRIDCPHCNQPIGYPMVYKKERRPAIRLIKGAVVKQKSDGTYPPKIDNLNQR